ncbi:hypothetical protein [Pantoea agglomerans]|uniref:hypothetical protein n=1 Tax=Enterobacter agglomerans TaxID=549 RepID=UPI00117D46CE|nr:hypothetical protein [Pantoea agglomerans]NKE96724.1 hypothetical protein [Pantoea agglomerans]TRO70078.1 hypothetical protein E5140_21560 [Pantoea agglomerans]
MNRLPLIILLFMSGIIFNCLRQLLEWSVSFTYDVLTGGSLACLVLIALGLIAELIAWRRSRGGRGGHHEA